MPTYTVICACTRYGRMQGSCIRRRVEHSWHMQPVIIISMAGTCGISTSGRESWSSHTSTVDSIYCWCSMQRSCTTKANCRAMKSIWRRTGSRQRVRLMAAGNRCSYAILIGAVKWWYCSWWLCTANTRSRASIKVRTSQGAICLVVRSMSRCRSSITITAACHWRAGAGHVFWWLGDQRSRCSWCWAGNCSRRCRSWTHTLCC